MKVKVLIDKTLENEVIITCKEITREIEQILNMLQYTDKLVVKKSHEEVVIDVNDIFHVDTTDDKVFIYTEKNVYETSYKIYELEEILPKDIFIRISKAAILNIFKIKKLRTDINRRIKITMINGEKEVVNRTYVAKFREKIENMKRRVINEKDI